MYIQIVNFNLKNTTPQDYEKLCGSLVSQFVSMPGLLAKVWLADPASNTFGGVYTWTDRASYEAYTCSELFKAVQTHPNLSNVTSKGFDVMEELTRQTRGLAQSAAA